MSEVYLMSRMTSTHQDGFTMRTERKILDNYPLYDIQ